MLKFMADDDNPQGAHHVSHAYNDQKQRSMLLFDCMNITCHTLVIQSLIKILSMHYGSYQDRVVQPRVVFCGTPKLNIAEMISLMLSGFITCQMYENRLAFMVDILTRISSNI